MAIGVLALLGFQLVDSAFVARLGTAPLAAQSFTFPLTFLVIGVQVGLGIAIAALISRALGAGEVERARRLGSLVLVVGSVTIALLVFVLWWAQVPIFSRLGADATARALIRAYWAPQLLAAWLGAVLYFVYSLFRAHGDTRLPGKLMVVTSLINLLLDPLFIFGVGPWAGLGLPGAAWATAIAFGSGLLLAVYRLRRRDWLTRHGLRRELAGSAGAFAGIAGPAMVSQLMPPLAAMLAVSVVAGLGESAVAAWGLASRLETLALVVVLAMTMSLPPWLGRCYGAGDWAQVRQLIRLALRVVIGWQLLLGGGLALLSPWVSQLLAGSADVRSDLTVLVRFLLPSYAALGVCMLVVSAGNALGWPLRAMLMSTARLFLCYLPFLWLGSSLAGLPGLAMGAAFGNVVAGTLAWRLMRHMLARSSAEAGVESKLLPRERT
ncbi:MATE family efflux transporter [Halomonas sp. MCCC 1A17488]|uniref:MATE family efflux transporter n=1 Tax=unclassified Halomonas TaxID=2609666 RepID=UPI0018D1FA69|nr:MULTISPECIES: MATE family efflux transporter [unclassified Halomonas]MCE8014749.1 MATE family efflux transporter [Halomonas sp. MCCC 1A17488]MCG3238082.1 MATE family efflux transporter [Halomonas sp. MCCC 1A17488]QPP51628.1 polysaccharide biosynthesis C-terminal domain-containing protein [Halomonas sp. SS10-MC5]